jgi:hypothetical protein
MAGLDCVGRGPHQQWGIPTEQCTVGCGQFALRRLVRLLCLHRNRLGRAVWIGSLMRPDVPALGAAVILNERVLTGVLQQTALDLADRAQAVWHGFGGCEVYATHEVAVHSRALSQFDKPKRLTAVSNG